MNAFCPRICPQIEKAWTRGGQWTKIHHKSIQKAPLGIDQEEQFYSLNKVGTLLFMPS